MSALKLFRIADGNVIEIEGHSVAVEKSLQTLVEQHMDPLLGIRFLATEYGTGTKHGGRIDTLGLDENGYPVIVEYKRALNQNVINQGLYYLDWLLDHQAEFYLLVMRQLGKDAADSIDWSSPRLVCIAGNYTKFDEYAVGQINRNIELMRYRRYGQDLLLLELINFVEASEASSASTSSSSNSSSSSYPYMKEVYETAPQALQDRFQALAEFLMALGDDVQQKWLKLYVAFRRIRNFATVKIQPHSGVLQLWVALNPDEVELEDGFTRDVRKIGHHGTGDLEITIKNDADLERAKPLLVKSYETS